MIADNNVRTVDLEVEAWRHFWWNLKGKVWLPRWSN